MEEKNVRSCAATGFCDGGTEEQGHTEICNGTELRFYTVRKSPFRVYGAYDSSMENGFLRIPRSVAEATSEGTLHFMYHTSGIRVRFRTNSRHVAVRLVTHTMELIPNMPLMGIIGCDMYRRDADGYRYIGTFADREVGARDVPKHILENHGYTDMLPTEGEWGDDGKDLVLNLPIYGTVDELFIGLDPDAYIEEASPYRDDPPVVFYGSSITQGLCVSRPGGHYSSILSRRYNIDIRDLGFAGYAKGETAMAEYIATLPMSAFVMAYDYNAPTPEHLEATHEPFYRIVRAAHPDVPVIFTTRPQAYYGEEECRRRTIIRSTYENAVMRGERVYFADGEAMFRECPMAGDNGTADMIHPNSLGNACIAEYLNPFFEEIFGKADW